MIEDIEKFIQDLGREIKEASGDYIKGEALERLEEAARAYRGEDNVISSLELYEKIKSQPEEKKILTGFTDFDKILGGFRKKQLIVVSASTKSGKTSFCMDITDRIRTEHPLWLPFEEPAEELIVKFHEQGLTPPLFYTPEKMLGNTLVWLEKKIIESKAKYNSSIVFIDHLHFIVDMTGAERMDVQIGITMRELKKMAKRWNVIIVLIAHLKKTRVEQQPDLEDLRDSSFIAQEADTVIFLWRETKKVKGEVVVSNNVNVSVQANRRTGKTGNVKMVYRNGRFVEEEWRRNESSALEKAQHDYDEFGN